MCSGKGVQMATQVSNFQSYEHYCFTSKTIIKYSISQACLWMWELLEKQWSLFFGEEQQLANGNIEAMAVCYVL